ncbi:MAG: GDSL-type esterase/lipase family protein [Verrucomicrobiales bacterium]|jgi:lysophospholipase L1-like esterase|nr:GDSL-type esterase/lipase family protein [Verrucomicrobiales bacterium]
MKHLLVLTVLLACQQLNAQPFNPATARYAKDIAAFAERDQEQAALIAQTPTLFVGSSTFTLWKDVGEYFPGQLILNRAFGGSNLADQIYWLPEVLLKYQPRKIVLYCGENDVAAGASAEMVADRFRVWFRQVRKQLPDSEIVYVSMKPSPAREKFIHVMQQGNLLIMKFIAEQERAHYADIAPLMVNPDGQPRTDIFTEDMLHMNKAGYQLWQKALAPYL